MWDYKILLTQISTFQSPTPLLQPKKLFFNFSVKISLAIRKKNTYNSKWNFQASITKPYLLNFHWSYDGVSSVSLLGTDLLQKLPKVFTLENFKLKIVASGLWTDLFEKKFIFDSYEIRYIGALCLDYQEGPGRGAETGLLNSFIWNWVNRLIGDCALKKLGLFLFPWSGPMSMVNSKILYFYKYWENKVVIGRYLMIDFSYLQLYVGQRSVAGYNL